MSEEQNGEKLMLTAEETCKALGLSRATVYSMIQNGSLPVVRIGTRAVRVPVKALRAWVDERIEQGVHI